MVHRNHTSWKLPKGFTKILEYEISKSVRDITCTITPHTHARTHTQTHTQVQPAFRIYPIKMCLNEKIKLNFIPAQVNIRLIYFLLRIWSDLIWYDILSLTAVGLTPGISRTVHIYTQTIRRTTHWNTIHRRENEIRGRDSLTQLQFGSTLKFSVRKI